MIDGALHHLRRDFFFLGLAGRCIIAMALNAIAARPQRAYQLNQDPRQPIPNRDPSSLPMNLLDG